MSTIIAVKAIWRGRTVIHVVLDTPATEAVVTTFRASLEARFSGLEAILSRDKREFSVEVPQNTREVYDFLRRQYPPRLQYNVMLTKGVVECGLGIGERVFAGFLLLDPYVLARKAAINVLTSLGAYQKRLDGDRVRAFTHLRASNPEAIKKTASWLEKRSVYVTEERSLPRPMLLADAVIFMKQMENLLDW